MKIVQTSVIVDNPRKAFKFYTEVLGLVARLYVPEANLAIVVSPEEQAGTRLLLEPNDNPIARIFQEAIYQQGLPVIVFAVEDIQREYERMTELGVAFTQVPTQTEAGTVAVFDDTCGNFVQLYQQ